MSERQEDGEQTVENEEECLTRHRKEKKELQVEIQRLKHSVPKGDKKKKKEITAQIAVLEAELDEKHNQEICEVKSRLMALQVTENCESTNAPVSDTLVNGMADMFDKKPSKAQRRKDKKSQKQVEREERIRDQEVLNLCGARHVEAEKIKAALKARGLSIKEIPSDGNCLYAAIADQLQQKQREFDVKSLRCQVADYLRKNRDEILPFLIKEGTEDTYNEEEYMAYCLRVESTSEWGGHTEIRALSDVLSSPIEVIQADGANVVIGENLSGSQLIVTYHRHAYGLGEHYNSVVPATKTEDDASS